MKTSLFYLPIVGSRSDIMAGMAGKPKSEGERWMAEAKARFEAAR